jgi:hypothetical protein
MSSEDLAVTSPQIPPTLAEPAVPYARPRSATAPVVLGARGSEEVGPGGVDLRVLRVERAGLSLRRAGVSPQGLESTLRYSSSNRPRRRTGIVKG